MSTGKFENRGEYVARLILDAILLFATITMAWSFFTSEGSPDIAIYEGAADALLQGTNAYDLLIPVAGHRGDIKTWRYLYPPLLAATLATLKPIGKDLIRHAWIALEIGALFGTVELLRRSGVIPKRRLITMTLLLCAWPPTVDAIAEGQIDVFVLFFLALTLYGLLRDRYWIAGSALALAVHLKFTPILLLLAFMRPKYCKAIPAFMLALGAIALCISAIYGTAVWLDFARSIPATSSGEITWAHDTNLVLVKIFAHALPSVTAQTALQLQAALFITVSIVFSAWAARTDFSVARSYALLVILMITTAPIVWYHHLVWLSIPIAVCLGTERTHLPYKISAVLGISTVTLSVYPQFYPRAVESFAWGSAVLGVGLSFLGLSLLQASTKQLRYGSKDRQ